MSSIPSFPARPPIEEPGLGGWEAQLRACYGSVPAPELRTPEHPRLDLATLKLGRAADSAPFLELVRPLLEDARRRLDRGLEELAREARKASPEGAFPEGGSPWEADAVVLDLLSQLASRVVMMLRRPLVLELHVARLEGSLEGDTPQERFASFVDRLGRPEEALELLDRYPVLARQLVERLDQGIRAHLELLGRFLADRPRLAGLLATGVAGDISSDPGRLLEIRPGEGDRHRDGRSVASLALAPADGSRLRRVVYKPRPLGVERRFNELLAWLNERGFEPAFRTLEILDRGSHGWVEHAAAEEAGGEEEIVRFYRRQGGYLALLHVLEANDFHFENLVAAGEHPVLIDLETLFHPTADLLIPGLPAAPPGHPIHRTVLNTGLLPQQLWKGAGPDTGVDLSGLSAASGQTTTHEVLGIAAPGTDAMRFEKAFDTFPEMSHRPRLDGEEVPLLPYRGAILRGFRDLYRLLMAHRRELLAPDGPLEAFADEEVRVILRPSRSYGLLQFESFHPDFLQDEADRRDLFRRYLSSAVERRPALGRVLDAELRDLDRLDIPLFTHRPGGREVWTADGERLEGLLPASGLERVRQKVHALGQGDLERQLWIVRSSLDTLSLRQGVPPRPSYHFEQGAEAPAGSELRALARAAAERLEALAFRPGPASGSRDPGPDTAASWLIAGPLDAAGASPDAGHGAVPWGLEPADLTLYEGLPGIALFLAQAGVSLDEPRWGHLARQAWATVEHRLEVAPPAGVGAFTGWGGILYAMIRLGDLWREPAWLDRAVERLAEVPGRLEEDAEHDVVGGAAGLAVVLLELYRHRPEPGVLELARACGDRLLAAAEPMEVGCGWVLPPAGPIPLAGLAHGAAGIAWALLRLARASGDDKYREKALEALAYERHLFDPAEGNWPDLRQGRPTEGGSSEQDGSSEASGPGCGQHFMVAWCQGAPGIGLARLACLDLLEGLAGQEGIEEEIGAEIRTEIRTALGTTLERGFGTNHSLCHGDLGNLELPLAAAGRFGGGGWSETGDLGRRTGRLAAGVVRGLRREGFLHGLPVGLEPLGLMVGLAGIGYQLLRLANPERVPSVLTLETAARGVGALQGEPGS